MPALRSERVPAGMLTSILRMICDCESIEADTDLLASIARAAEGSVRDALSLLDQAAAMSADKLTNDLGSRYAGTAQSRRVKPF